MRAVAERLTDLEKGGGALKQGTGLLLRSSLRWRKVLRVRLAY
jgi:hypothetical protein